jgi:hypothetical protein
LTDESRVAIEMIETGINGLRSLTDDLRPHTNMNDERPEEVDTGAGVKIVEQVLADAVSETGASETGARIRGATLA